MKLAEALMLRADYQRRIGHLKQRLLRNAKVQEGDEPGEIPAVLLEEIERVCRDLAQLIQRINATNSRTELANGATLSDAIATRDVLRIKTDIYAELAKAATVTQDRYSKSEVKFRSTVNIADMQNRADALAKEQREIDARIQEANWRTDLQE